MFVDIFFFSSFIYFFVFPPCVWSLVCFFLFCLFLCFYLDVCVHLFVSLREGLTLQPVHRMKHKGHCAEKISSEGFKKQFIIKNREQTSSCQRAVCGLVRIGFWSKQKIPSLILSLFLCLSLALSLKKEDRYCWATYVLLLRNHKKTPLITKTSTFHSIKESCNSRRGQGIPRGRFQPKD